MYSSYQVLEISGNCKEQLAKAIEFALNYDDKKSSDMRGVSIKDGSIAFGWIPRNDDGTYEKDYVELWDTTLIDGITTVTTNLLVNTVYNFLKSNGAKAIYEQIWDKEGCGYWDTPTYGWKLIGFNHYTSDFPTFSIFRVEPLIEEFLG